MELQTVFHPDLTSFTQNSKPFVPRFTRHEAAFNQGGFDGIVITLDATLKSDLNWDIQQQKALKIMGQGGLILWDFDFGPIHFANCFDELSWSSAKLAIEHFCQTLYPTYAEASFGVNLTEKSLMPVDHAEASSLWHYFDVLSHELHRRGALFPEELMVFATFDCEGLKSPLMEAQLLSLRRFPHIGLILRGGTLPLFGMCLEKGETKGGVIDARPHSVYHPKVGLCLPQEYNLTPNDKSAFESILHQLKMKSIAYRIFDEELFNESWHDLEVIIVVPSAMDLKLLERHCMGFCVAGGNIVSWGDGLDLEESLSFEEWISG